MSREMNRLPAFPHVMVVEASAGSGKTYTLAKRYLQLFINPDLHPDEIPLKAVLAVTFTNKAAREMKERILDFLKKIVLDSFPNAAERQDIMSALRVPEEQARARAALVLREILGNYNFFQVKTIDSLINGILSGCAFKLDLSAYFRTDPHHERYLAYSLDALIDEAAHEKAVAALFKAFIRQYLFIENKSGWFPRQDILNVISDLFKKNNTHAGDFVASHFDVRHVIEAKKNVLSSMRCLKDHLPDATHAKFAATLDTFLSSHDHGFSIDEVSDFFARGQVPVRKGGVVSPEAGALWERIRKGLAEVCDLEALSLFNAYIDIFSRVVHTIRDVTRKDDVLFLEALNKEAHLLFTVRSLSLPELYYRLATRFRHFLIDEFQDTSHLQWQNFRAMALEALASGGSLFYVGDRKQAIYRFRGGEVGFIDAVREQLRAFPFILDTLHANYRSAPEIVRFNNSVFSTQNLRRFFCEYAASKKDEALFDQGEIFSVFETSQQEPVRTDTQGFVSVTWIDNRNREDLHAASRAGVLEALDRARHRYAYRDICLLVRTNDEVELATGWLLEQGIPVASEKTLNIRENAHLKEVLSFLRFLQSPIDNISFASFILGEIFQRSSGLSDSSVREFLFSLNRDSTKSGYVYRAFRLAFARAWEDLIEPFFTSVGFVPLYELVVSVYHRFDVMKAFPASQGFFMRLLELITQEEERHAELAAFLEYLEDASDDDLFVKVADADAVRVLTVHKAKGLEFPVVILPLAQMNIKPSRDVVVAGEQDTLQLVHLKTKYGSFSPMLNRLAQAEYGRAFLDELNNLYVAFTRARDELHVFVGQRAESSLNPVRLLLPSAGTWGRVEESAQPSCGTGLQSLSPSVHGDWIRYLKEEHFDSALVRHRDVVMKGECMHAVLAGVGNLQGRDADASIRQALMDAKRLYPAYRQWDEIMEKVGTMLASGRLSRYFTIPQGKVFTEQEIVTPAGETYRIDRLVITAGEVTVIDYKSSREHLEESRRQVRGYAAMVKGMYPGRRVCGTLIFLDSLESEEVAL